MKSISLVRKLLFINLVCLLWCLKSYFCDIILDEGNIPQYDEANSLPFKSIRSENIINNQETPQQANQESTYENTQNDEFVNIPETKVKENSKNDENIKLKYSNSAYKLNKRQPPLDLDSSRESNEKEKLNDPLSKINSQVIETEESQDIADSQEKLNPSNLDDSHILSSSLDLESPSLEFHSPHENLAESSIISKFASPNTVLQGPNKNDASQDNFLSEESISDDNNEPKLDTNQQQPHYDGMPSFDEWKKMMLAEQEKGGQKVQSSSLPGKKVSSQKRRRNYSSYECGAKIVASNSEAEGKSRILNELVDEYMLNPCKAKIWFVIELCETVQASQIELANFELFSSCPKDFAVYSSDNFPTREWVQLGAFTAVEQRVLQSFELKQEGFGKFIKIELLSHYGKEHYCPLSIVRIFGTSMVDEYEEMETLDTHVDVPDDDLDRLDIPIGDQGPSNIFGSATDAVINGVKKAAQALGLKPLEEEQVNETAVDQQNISHVKDCQLVSPSSEKCEASATDKDSPILPEFIVPPNSVHNSLFRLLKRCDQCISSHIGYYSSAQPHCRFFQVALGPVMFQTLCDWLKVHPPLVEYNMPVSVTHIKDGISDNVLTISPTKSPPPQILRLPIDKDSLTVITLGDNSSYTKVDKNLTDHMARISTLKANKTSIQKTKLEPSMHSTQSFTSIEVDVTIDDRETIDKLSESSGGSDETLQTLPTKASVVISEKTQRDHLQEESSDNIASAEFTDSPIAVESKDQIDEMLSETNIVTEDMADTLAITELPPVIKISDDKLQEIKTEQGKSDGGAIPASAAQKESVFMRMNNRIKSLEINMSLSSQYLQELSQRYRRQMEDMQRAFNRTIGTLNDTTRKAAEKDVKQQDIINRLQLQVENLTNAIEILLQERATLTKYMLEIHVGLMIAEAIIMITIMSLCVRRVSSTYSSLAQSEREIVSTVPQCLTKRRNSADFSTSRVKKVKKRSASEEDLVTGEHLLNVEPLPLLMENSAKIKKKNKKRNKGIHRSSSHPTVQHRNPSPISHYNKDKKLETHSDGCILLNSKSRHSVNKLKHLCENCTDSICITRVPKINEKRPNTLPLKNLTNGGIEQVHTSSMEKNKNLKEKEKFSFKKFLKFQKRESI